MLPPLPESMYTRYYCEENVYLLCKTFFSRPEISRFWSIFVVFLSNENKTVALWAQKAGGLNRPVVWDYHVILVLKSTTQDRGDFNSPAHQESGVYDFDTILPMPCSWEDYFSCTFLDGLPSNYQSEFRVIPGELFVKHFASDRSHMLIKTLVGASDESPDKLLDEEPSFHSPPPPYPPIRGQSAIDNGINHNLMSHYVDMVHADDSGAYGKVYGYQEVLEFFGGSKHGFIAYESPGVDSDHEGGHVL